MITEVEAKTKWCPLVHFTAETDRAFPITNREERIGTAAQGEITRCIGSACMAWRWANPYPDEREQWSGYCGAFGRPPGAPQ